jgi:nucleotide-binding universal stress UspA family protein
MRRFYPSISSPVAVSVRTHMNPKDRSHLRDGESQSKRKNEAKEDGTAFLDRIVMATDSSAEAAFAERVATSLSVVSGSELHLLTVGDSETDAEKTLSEARRGVEEVGGRVAVAHSVSGRADDRISAVAEDLHASLIVVGNRGLGALKRTVMGSVSESVVRHAHCSVLVVRDGRGTAPLPEKILAAVDGSEESKAAANMAAEVAGAVGAELHLVYATPIIPSVTYPGTVITKGAETTFEHLRDKAQAVLAVEEERLGNGAVSETHLLTGGQPDDAILDAAEDIGAGLLVVGSRGFGGVRRTLLGSVSDSVVRRAHCSVMVARG